MKGCFSRIGARIRPGRSEGPGAACRLVGEEDDFASCQLSAFKLSAFKLMPTVGTRRRARPARAILFHRPQPLQGKVKGRLAAEMERFARNDVTPSRRTWSGSKPMTGASGAILRSGSSRTGAAARWSLFWRGRTSLPLVNFLPSCSVGIRRRPNQHAQPFSTVRNPVKRR
jgi:hypothetical protein